MVQKRKFGLSRRIGALAFKDSESVAKEVIKALVDAVPANIATWRSNYLNSISAYIGSDSRVNYAKAKLAEWYKILKPKASDIAKTYSEAVAKYKAIPIVPTAE
jgi:hypothetical protein